MRYLFICGCGHSGTTLALSIFAQAPFVYAIKKETRFLQEHSVKEFKTEFGDVKSGTKLIVEKTPRHIYQLEKICADEDSDALVLYRNPIDVVASLVKKGGKIKNAIERYENDNRHWLERQSSLKFTVLKYEDFVTKTDAVLDQLGRAYGVDLKSANDRRLETEELYLDGDQARLTDGRGVANHRALRNYQVRQPIQNMNGAWRERIGRRDLNLILKRLEPLIEALGYQECFDYKI